MKSLKIRKRRIKTPGVRIRKNSGAFSRSFKNGFQCTSCGAPVEFEGVVCEFGHQQVS